MEDGVNKGCEGLIAVKTFPAFSVYLLLEIPSLQAGFST